MATTAQTPTTTPVSVPFDLMRTLWNAEHVIWVRVMEHSLDGIDFENLSSVTCPVELYMECRFDKDRAITARLPITATFTDKIKTLTAVNWLTDDRTPVIDDLYQLEFCNIEGVNLADFGELPHLTYTGAGNDFIIFCSENFLQHPYAQEASKFFMLLAQDWIQNTDVEDIEVDYF